MCWSSIPIDERRLSRLCIADRDLAAIIELHVDLDDSGGTPVPVDVFERLAERCREQADAVTLEVPAMSDVVSDPAEGLRGHRQHESTLQSLKRIKQGTPLAVTELWDESAGSFTEDTGRMAKLIQVAAQDRQVHVRSSPLRGQDLFDQWRADFSRCRTCMERHEIETLTLDSPNGKKPSPDGLPAVFLKRYYRQLAVLFLEAWNELTSGQASMEHVKDCLILKKWIVVPKAEGTNTINKMRDLELGNDVRKVLARMLFKVLDEVCRHETHGLCNAQQAFVTGRDITRNTTMLCRNFWAAHVEAIPGDDPYLLHALDCSKGYNRMDHSWLPRCLHAASTPPEILALVDCLLVNMPVLVLAGVEFAALELASGLTQSCPASCMLYIIGVDPLLSPLQHDPLVSGVSGFVDDWSMGCKGMNALSAVSNLILSFEQALGQKINREKSALIPALSVQHALQFGAVIFGYRPENVCLGFALECRCRSTTSTMMQSTNSI